MIKTILAYDFDYGRLKDMANLRGETPSMIDNLQKLNTCMSIWEVVKGKDIGILKNRIKQNMNVVNAQTYFLRNTPLHIAIMEGNITAIKLLSNENCDLNIKNSEGITALDLLKRVKGDSFGLYADISRLIKAKSFKLSSVNVIPYIPQ